MRYKKTQQLILLASVMFCSTASLANPQKASKTSLQTQRNLQSVSVAKRLGWVKTGGLCDLCDGFYQQPKNLLSHPNPISVRRLPTDVVAYGPTVFRRDGQSELTGGVVVTQTGRRITADRALVTRDAKTSKVTALTLMGHVHLQQYGKLIVAPYAHLDLSNKTVVMRDAVYHVGNMMDIAHKGSKNTYDAWGYAGYVHNASASILNLRNASYTTCSPLNPVWMVSARKIHLDRQAGIGKVYSGVLRIKKVPVMYVPYLWFPIDNRRVTGFLFPGFSHSSKRGFAVDTPFYWNMAPNYDATITPRYMTKRGFEISDFSRYITHGGYGKLDVNYLPNDPAFKRYRQDNINDYASDTDLKPYVDKLRGYHNWRGFFAFNGQQQWSDDWHSDLHLNYVTDPYYFRDLGTPVPLHTPDQLLNEFDTKYAGDNWNVSTLVQAYQTLHRIDESDNPVFNQYQRLPELDLQSFYPNVWPHTTFDMQTQFVNFNFNSDFPTQFNTLPTPEGQRLHIRPGLVFNFNSASSYISPGLYVDATGYSTHFKATNESPSRNRFDRARVLPIVSLDSGLYFDRRTQLFGQEYIQTLEPRAFYLYVPYQNQSDYPDFDTQLLPFSYSQLYRLNRFMGYDRLQNANQLSLGLTSRLLTADNATQRLIANLGMIVYFQKPKVTLPGVDASTGTLSPLIGSVNYQMSDYWSTASHVAWDFHHEHMNNAGSDIIYSDHARKIIDFGYGYVHDTGQTSLGYTNSTNEIHGGVSFPIHYRWTALGYISYNFAQAHPDTMFTGLQYDSCCWALRFIFDRHFTGRSPGSTVNHVQNQYDNIYYLQLLLKGLGSVGNSSPASLLRSALSGYKDPFETNY